MATCIADSLLSAYLLPGQPVRVLAGCIPFLSNNLSIDDNIYIIHSAQAPLFVARFWNHQKPNITKCLTMYLPEAGAVLRGESTVRSVARARVARARIAAVARAGIAPVHRHNCRRLAAKYW